MIKDDTLALIISQKIDYGRIKYNLRSPEFLVCYYFIKSIISLSWTMIGAYCTRKLIVRQKDIHIQVFRHVENYP